MSPRISASASRSGPVTQIVDPDAAAREPIISGDRPLCFLHIAKTGGTSVTDAIARLFPPDRVFTDRGNLSVDYLEGLGKRLAGRIFLAGHPCPESPNFSASGPT